MEQAENGGRRTEECSVQMESSVRRVVPFSVPRFSVFHHGTKSRFTIRGKTLTNASLHKSIVGLPPLAPPEYRGEGDATILFMPPLYSGGLGGLRGPPRSFPRIVRNI